MFSNRSLGGYPVNNAQQGMEAVPIRQRAEGADGSPMAQRRIVKVYFIGYRMLHSPGPDPESQWTIDPETKKRVKTPQDEWVMLPATISPIVTVRGRAMKMPALGEMFEVDELLAQNLQRRLRTWDPKTNEPYEGLTYDVNIAKAVKEAFERGDVANLKLTDMTKAAKLVEVSDDDLIREIERRSAARQALAGGGEAEQPGEPGDEKPKRGKTAEQKVEV